jgi:hypothetical protein
MYLRTTQRRNKDGSIVRYYALAENTRHREKGHVEARVVHSFGRADRLDRTALERLVRSIRRVLDAGEPAADGSGQARRIEASFELGVVHVVAALWARLGIGRAIAARLAADERRAPHEAALLAMTAQRLARPGSKLACHARWLKRVWRPGIFASTSSIARWTSLPSTAMGLSRRCSGTAPICSSWTSTWSSMTPPPLGSNVMMRTSRPRAGAA